MTVTVMWRIFFTSFVFLIASTGIASAATLTVEIVGVASDSGDVHIALYDDPAAFPKSQGMLIKKEVPIENGVASGMFSNLAAGRYAIAIYHDENGNNKFDQGLFGIPLEDFGFSNDVTVFLSAPDFEDAAFDVPDSGATIRIHLNR